MNPYLSYLNSCVNNNINQFKNYNGNINWVKNAETIYFENLRKDILSKISDLSYSFNKLKPWYFSLSKGCEICGAGEWSCLFINSICNAKCFYCPSRQDLNEPPSSQMKTFKTPNEYADYINFFNYKGVSISGGEPLLDFQKSLEYLKAIQEKCSNDIYVWLYTNGLIGTSEKYKELNKAGVDEVRFNIGASSYNLKLIEKASNYIDNITVEIPAIPQDQTKLMKILPQLIDIGVKNLNLHSLRLTPYNINKFFDKKYTYAHGESATVIESEIAALNLIRYASDKKLKIGINYCSYPYKLNFQKSGYRKTIAKKLLKPDEEITDNGYIRKLYLTFKKTDLMPIKYVDLTANSKNIKHIQLEYNALLLRDYNTNDNKLDILEINGKKYSVNNVKKYNNIMLTTNSFLKILKLKSAKNIKNENDFKVFQMECINSEHQEYY